VEGPEVAAVVVELLPGVVVMQALRQASLLSYV
jgi:hypothetical protein